MRRIKLIILIFVLSKGLTTSMAQDLSNNNIPIHSLEIEWQKQIPDPEIRIKKPAIQRIGELIIGKKEVNIIRPVDVQLLDHDKMLILCQENGQIIDIDGNSIDLLNIRNKNKPVFPSLISACSPGDNKILITDSANNMVYLINSKGYVSEFCNKNLLIRPSGICYSPSSKTVWVVESGAHRISVFNIEGNLIKHIGERGNGKGQFNYPGHICCGENGKIYVVDAMNFRIQIFSPDGEYNSSFGKHGDASGSFSRPKGIACDSFGNIYIVDALFNSVQIFNSSGDFLYYFGSRGSGKGEFLLPSGIDIDENNYIYISDSFNNRVQVFKAIRKQEK